ncbi:hypothetical protein G9A89_017592 [Geosiphon pyriformis]|nr:hypothetical protein G9A89_017592 [Geosiphon pyriformis]
MYKKKAPKNIFYGPVSGSFLQKKKVVLKNIKHSGDKKNISLNKSGLGNNMFFDVNSLSGNEKSVDMTGIDDGSLLNSVANTLKAKYINTGIVFSFLNFDMNDDIVIIKTPVEVSVKRLFALNINFLAVDGKSVTAKTQLIRKLFSSVNGFGEATTSSKFEKIIRSTFTSKKSIEMTMLLVREKEINAVVIKKIPINTPKNIIITALFLIGKNSVHIVKAVRDYEIWASRNQFKALLFILPVGTTAYNLGTFLKKAGKKTCIINRFMETDNRIHCTVIGFNFNDNLESAFCIKPIFSRIKLSWTRINLVYCEKCGHIGYLALKCNVSDISVLLLSKKLYKKIAFKEVCFQLAKLYEKKSILISYSAVFGGGTLLSTFANTFFLSACLAFLECFLKLLTNQVSGIMHKLNNFELMPQDLFFSFLVLDTPMAAQIWLVFLPLFFIVSDVLVLGLSSLKVLTIKVGFLGSKLMALNASVGLVLVKLDQLCAELDSQVFMFGLNKCFLSVEVAIIMNNFLVIEINSFIARTVNTSTFMVLGEDFNKNSFKRKIKKVIDYIFVNKCLLSVIVGHGVVFVSDFFNTDHKAVMISVGLGELLDFYLNGLYKQANKNHWKFKIADANALKWAHFKKCVSMMIDLANKIFSKYWFHDINCSFNKHSSKFFKLELLIAKMVKFLQSGDFSKTALLLNA